MRLVRLFQVIKYGWRHAGVITAGNRINQRVLVFLDILRCFRKYHMWSNQYLKEHINELPADQRKEIGLYYLQINNSREEWVKDHLANKRFFNKWGSFRNEVTKRRIKKRIQAYSIRYNMGQGCNVSFNVLIDRKHFLQGTIKIGNHCLLGKNTHIDYSGFLEIGNDVHIAEGALLLTHLHRHHSVPNNPDSIADNDLQVHLKIYDGAVIGAHSIILPTCNEIGRFARIGAGAVVTKDVPDYAIVAGVPARVIRIMEHPNNQ